MPQLGIAAYLLKPVRKVELREAIARLLGAKDEISTATMITRDLLQAERDPDQRLDILLAEDNIVNQKLAVRLLEKRGHKVMVAGNGREALAALAHRPYDLVLMDVQMPELGGIEATTILREKEKLTGGHQFIVAMTALVMKNDRERCLAAGMDDYLPKPIRPQELDEALDVCMAKRSSAPKEGLSQGKVLAITQLTRTNFWNALTATASFWPSSPIYSALITHDKSR